MLFGTRVPIQKKTNGNGFEVDFETDIEPNNIFEEEHQLVDDLVKKEYEEASQSVSKGESLVTQEVGDGYFNNPDYRRMISDFASDFKEDQSDDDTDEENDETSGGTKKKRAEEEFDPSLSSFQRRAAKMVDISDGEKLVFKKVLHRGEGSPATPGALAIFHYKLFLEDVDEPFDSTRLRNRVERQRIGEESYLVYGLNLAVMSMKRKEVSGFVLDYRVMFQEAGVQPRIPPKADIYAEVELIDFIERDLIHDYFDKTEEEKREMTFQEILSVVKQCRQDGNCAFRNHRYAPAAQKYMRALRVLYECMVKDEEEDNWRKTEAIKLNLNLAQAFLSLGRSMASIKCCNDVLADDPKNVKALYRKGKALTMTKDFDSATSVLNTANKLDPKNKDILDAIKSNDCDKMQALAMEKSLCSRMFNMPAIEGGAGKPKKVAEPDMSTNFATTLKNNLTKFAESDEVQYPAYDKSLFDTEKRRILDAIVKDLNLWIVEKDNGLIIRKKRSIPGE